MDLTLTIGVGLLVCLLYGLLFQRHIDQLSEKLRTAKKGRRRKKYVRLFISALNGENIRNETVYLATLTALLPMVVMVGVLVAFIEVTDWNADLKVSRQQLDEIAEGVDQLDSSEPSDGPEDDLDRIRDKIPLLREQQSVLEQKAAWATRSVAAWWIVCTVWLAQILFWQLPNRMFRVRFENALQQFVTAVQCLATKDEVRGLIMLRIAARDETSARAFVNEVHRISVKYAISSLIHAFMLWDED